MPKRHNTPACGLQAQLLQIVDPPLHHLPPLVEARRMVKGPSVGVTHGMRHILAVDQTGPCHLPWGCT